MGTDRRGIGTTNSGRTQALSQPFSTPKNWSPALRPKGVSPRPDSAILPRVIVVPNPLEFFTSASPRSRRALLASGLGWMLDGMDVTLYSMVISELLRELHLSTAQAGLLASVTLIASGIGGVLFGVLADRLGRRTALILSIATYSLATAACGLSRGITELVIFRCIVGLGMGGEWGTGAALVSETWKPEHRGKALGLMQSGYAAGYACAAVVAALVMPRWGWRGVFFVGIFPALLTLWISARVEESPLWKAGQASRATTSIARGFFAKPFRSLLLLVVLINAAALFAWWGLFTWIPSYLALPASQGGKGMSIAASAEWILVMQAGMCLGSVLYGFFSDAAGRKKTYVGFLLLAAALVPAYAHARAVTLLLVVGPLLAFFATGQFAGFAAITAELFPTSFRASAMGFAYNFGRALSAAAPWAVGILAGHGGLGSAFWISGIAFLLAAALALGVPETRGKTLD